MVAVVEVDMGVVMAVSFLLRDFVKMMILIFR